MYLNYFNFKKRAKIYLFLKSLEKRLQMCVSLSFKNNGWRVHNDFHVYHHFQLLH